MIMRQDDMLNALSHHQKMLLSTRISALFADNPQRFSQFSAESQGLLLDYSKCKITHDTRAMLIELAEVAGVPAAREAMFNAQAVNNTENRAALHIALRDFSGKPVVVEGVDYAPAIRDTRERCFAFAEAIRSGNLTGATGKRFTDVVNIGIGGSDLGPAMTTLALAPYHDGPTLHYVSNVDSAHLADTLKGLDAAHTLFIIASKTFTTIETMTNARSARAWLVSQLGESAVNAHFCAVSTALDKVEAFGIARERAFGFWDFIGGRYSIWSSIGLPVMIAVGAAQFTAFLKGAEAMDIHFHHAPLAENLPVLMGLIGIWHRNCAGYSTRAVIPYDQRLSRFPAYLQQLDMESNGKSVLRDGTAAPHKTGPIMWGEPGTNSQHAFFQLLHQGTDIIPVEFLIAAQAHEQDMQPHHALLLANCFAQSQALMQGRTLEEASGNPHRVFAGDRPSITLLYPKLDAFRLGQIIALYEHRVFVEAAIWGINPFDQWGVELGKELANQLDMPVKTGEGMEHLDSSTAGLIHYARDVRAHKPC